MEKPHFKLLIVMFCPSNLMLVYTKLTDQDNSYRPNISLGLKTTMLLMEIKIVILILDQLFKLK
ncbi:hypothetical protein AO462_03065 [Oenococcus oeni]|uniref:Uncharacterized protein n=1 Tax=Oenococcus oeni TaxID=1247 RepID=A0AAQ2URW8_OENOE|nr:hypothetical protein AO462_03065 [Oenococcus oeni]SYW05480.1 conserved hypothetical protein [Oenococcus oeni]VDB97764.1 conserved protein of unknown function [Oenococcus oeni]